MLKVEEEIGKLKYPKTRKIRLWRAFHRHWLSAGNRRHVRERAVKINTATCVARLMGALCK